MVATERGDAVQIAVIAIVGGAAHRDADQVARGGGARADAGADLDHILVALLIVGELGLQRLDEQAVTLGRTPLHAGHGPGGLAEHEVLAVVEGGRGPGRIIDSLAVVRDLVAAVARDGREHAEGVARPGGAQAVLFLVAAAEVHLAPAQVTLQVDPAPVEGAVGLQVDASDDRFRRHVGGQGLVDLKRAQDDGGHGVEAKGALIAALVDADDVDAVDRHAGPPVRRAADL